MTCTILFDLDDTLLKNEMGVFLPAYFQALQEGMAGVVDPAWMMPEFLAASQRMLGNDRPDRTLLQAFYDHFLPALDLSMAELAPAIDSFYSRDYGNLKQLTSPVPDAQDLVRECARRGYRMAIATNPLFPEVAIAARIEWAELPVAPERFELVTTGEISHFAKPSPAYYAEVMALLGWPVGPVLMVGNDPLNDIQGASRLGLPTFHVLEQNRAPENGFSGSRHAAGPLSGLLAWVDAGSPQDLAPDYRSRSAILAILQATPALFHTLFMKQAESAWDRRSGEEWTAHEVIHHLYEVDKRVNLPRLESFLTQESPFIPGVDTDNWHAGGFGSLPDVKSSVELFQEQRVRLIEAMRRLDEEDWALPARHAIFGPTDFREVAYIVARHDQLHIRQIREQLSPQSEALGSHPID